MSGPSGTGHDTARVKRLEPALCPFCGRHVDVYPDPTGLVLRYGHRITLPSTIETPWCEGGGRAA